MKPNSQKHHDRFVRIAAKRTEDILRRLVRLGNCATLSGYAYDPSEAEQIVAALEQGVANLKQQFEPKPRPDQPTFQFAEHRRQAAE